MKITDDDIQKYKDFSDYRDKVIEELDNHESKRWYDDLTDKLAYYSAKLVHHYYSVDEIKFHYPDKDHMKVYWIYENGGTYTDESILPLNFLDEPDLYFAKLEFAKKYAEREEEFKKEEAERQQLRELMEKHCDFAKSLIQ